MKTNPNLDLIVTSEAKVFFHENNFQLQKKKKHLVFLPAKIIQMNTRTKRCEILSFCLLIFKTIFLNVLFSFLKMVYFDFFLPYVRI